MPRGTCTGDERRLHGYARPIPSTTDPNPFRVVIAGGGVAGLETALALRDLAGETVDVTLVAPEAEFVYRPIAVQEPFSYPAAHRYSVADIASDAGARLVQDEFRWVDPAGRIAHTATATLPYDALVLALGATRRARFPRAVTLDDRRLDEILHGVIQDLEQGDVRSLAFLMPAAGCWPLPLYELALMSAARAYDMNMEVDVTLVTPEREPLEAFGDEASAAVAALLAERGIATELGADPQVPSSRRVVVRPGGPEIDADRVIALPDLVGPGVRGLRAGRKGFVPVDRYCRVRDTPGIFAVGDVADFPIKHGGLASQQADVAAHGIAELAGVPVTVTPFVPVVSGMLLTGRDPLYLRATVVGASGFSSQASAEPIWSPPSKIAARYLGPYLDRVDHATT